ncbi:MAG: mechanosensitive ion channel family protein [Parabacteroides sp.]
MIHLLIDTKVQAVLLRLLDEGSQLGITLIKALLVFVVGRIIIGVLNKLVRQLLARRRIDPSIRTFTGSLVNVVLTILLIVSVVGALGVQTTSFAALLASAGVAIGMALSGNLSNFAGGLVILLFKPFKVGDYIEAQGGSGVVREIQIFHTVLTTPDNKAVYIPNGALSSSMVTNFSRETTRRVDWVFHVEYGSDFEQVKQVLLRVIAADSRILQTPEPFVVLGQLSDSSVDVTVRVWVNSADYWNVFFEMNETVYKTFNQEGITFPFPQVTVHRADA